MVFLLRHPNLPPPTNAIESRQVAVIRFFILNAFEIRPTKNDLQMTIQCQYCAIRRHENIVLYDLKGI